MKRKEGIRDERGFPPRIKSSQNNGEGRKMEEVVEERRHGGGEGDSVFQWLSSFEC